MKPTIETLVEYWDFLSGLKEADPFWESISTNYTKQFAITIWKNDFYRYDSASEWLRNWHSTQSIFWGAGDKPLLKRMKQQENEN